jgi:uncharacterized membrane protein YdbT with pleckstrin-like domain
MDTGLEHGNIVNAKKVHHLDVLIRPSPFFLYANILAVQLIMGVFLLIVTFFPRLILGNAISGQVELVYQFKISILILMILIGEVFTLIGVARWVSEIYVLKNQTITHRNGVFFKDKRVIMLRNIVEVYLTQTLTGKIFNFGTIKIITPQAVDNIYLKKIEHPGKYFRMLKELVLEQRIEAPTPHPTAKLSKQED